MDRRMIGRTILALLALVTVAGCGGRPVVDPSPASSPASSPAPSAAGSAAPTTHVTVTLGIYSGRADPSWDLSDARAAEVVAAIAALPLADGTPPEGGLGYHGFTIVLRRTAQADETLVAYRAAIAPPGVGPRPYRIDTDRAVERLLLETGRATLTPAEIAVVEADLR
jgi:hypothetical protein